MSCVPSIRSLRKQHCPVCTAPMTLTVPLGNPYAFLWYCDCCTYRETPNGIESLQPIVTRDNQKYCYKQGVAR
jgi:hypothetical protein